MRSFLIITLVCLSTVGELVLARSYSSSHEWAQYKRQFNKSYTNQAKEARRHANFMASKAHIERHNANASYPYKLGLNHMSDWTADEFAKMTSLRVNKSRLVTVMSAEQLSHLNSYLSRTAGNDVPAEIDWRTIPNRVGEVKDQAYCGSAWAFATTGLLEGQQVLHIVTNKTVLMSEQNLVDCSAQNQGCNGGIMDSALDDIHFLGGIESESDYPYVSRNQICAFKKDKSVMTTSGSLVLEAGNERQLKEVVANYGPVSAGIMATVNLEGYRSGILRDSLCRDDGLNHAVLIVGYGTDPKHGDFWIVKNSWGKRWGENGYFRIERGTDMCGIAEVATIARF